MPKKDVYFNGMLAGSHESTGDPEGDCIAAEKVLKEKGLLEDIPLYKGMYGHANASAAVANELYYTKLRSTPVDGDAICPFIVNATFSAEVYLKAIHSAFGNKVKGHDLSFLYKGMPKRGKVHFEAAAEVIRPLYNLNTDSGVAGCIDQLKEAFVSWRYVYEHEKLETELQMIRYLMHVSHESTCRSIEAVETPNQAMKPRMPDGSA